MGLSTFLRGYWPMILALVAIVASYSSTQASLADQRVDLLDLRSELLETQKDLVQMKIRAAQDDAQGRAMQTTISDLKASLKDYGAEQRMSFERVETLLQKHFAEQHNGK